MDSAGIHQELIQLRSALTAHGVTIGRHELLIGQLLETIQTQGQALLECRTQLALRPLPVLDLGAAAPPPHPPAQREPRLPAPERYDGNPGGCRGFLIQVDLGFKLQPLAFPTDEAKVAYIITLLTHRALAWATAVWEGQTSACQDYLSFADELRRVFDHPVGGREAASRLMRIRQGMRSAAEYAIDFRTLAVESRWDTEALMATFQHGLTETLQDDLSTREPARNLEGLIDAAIRADNRHRERQRDRRSAAPSTAEPRTRPGLPEPQPLRLSQPPLPPREEPMQIGKAHLTSVERERRIKERCCLYCGLPGHFRFSCPELGNR